MINDAALQIATNMAVAFAAPAPGFIITPNTIDWSTVRDMGTGQHLMAMITVKTAITTTGTLGLLRFYLKLSNDSDPATPTPAASHGLQPTVGISGAYHQTALVAGAQIPIALDPLMVAHVIPFVEPSVVDVRGSRYVYGYIDCVSVVDGLTPVAVLTGAIDWDFVLHAHTSSVSGVAQQKVYGPGFSVV